MHFRPLTPAALVDVLAQRCDAASYDGAALRVALDAADAARPDRWADQVAEVLRARGRPTARVSMTEWLRPASVRLERGHQDPATYRDGWFDTAALAREVLDPCGPDGAGTWLPSLWDPVRDRATRARYRTAGPGTVLLVDGPMLLGHALPFDLTVHLHLSDAALRRTTPADEHWTITPLLAHEADTGSDELADVLVRAEHLDRPALRTR